jgi:hypothetical protein
MRGSSRIARGRSFYAGLLARHERAWRDEGPPSGAGSGNGDPPASGGGDPAGGAAGGAGSGGGTPDPASGSPSTAQLQAFAQQHLKQVTGAILGKARAAGLVVPRDATLNTLVEMASGLAGQLGEAQARVHELEDDTSTAKQKADYQKRLEEALAKQAGTYDEKIKGLESQLKSKTSALDRHVVHDRVGVKAKDKGFNSEALSDWMTNPRNAASVGVRFVLDEQDETAPLQILDLITGVPAINPNTRQAYTLDEKLEEWKADPTLKRLIDGKLAGGGGSGKETPSGADGGATRDGEGTPAKGDLGAEGKTSMDFFSEGIKAGELKGYTGP